MDWIEAHFQPEKCMNVVVHVVFAQVQYLNLPVNFSSCFVVTAYQRSLPEVKIEPQNGGESNRGRLRTPGAV